MKKLFLFAVLLGFAGCTNEIDEVNAEPAPETPQTEIVPVGEALCELYDLMGTISSGTRSAFDAGRAIRDIKVSGGSQATRGGGFDLPDTMVYVVNFTDDKGFAVLGARRSLEPVYAVTEAGSFDAEKLNTAIAEARAAKIDADAGTRTGNNEREVPEIGIDYAYILLADAMTVTPRIAADTISKSYGPWQVNATTGPLVDVKWNQTYPFNMKMPLSSSWEGSYYKGRYPVGCGIIAAAQMMTGTRRPSTAPGVSSSYNWTYLKSISNYTNLSSFTPGYTPENASSNVQTYVTQLADVLYNLGVKFKASYGTDGTGVYTGDVVAALKNMDATFYKNAEILSITATNMYSIYGCLGNNKPMYIRGSSASGGHAWVLDGYIDRSRIVTIQYRMGYTSPIQTLKRTEKGNYLHFNWGYQGKYDGYFAEGVFDMSKRISKDEIIDANIYPYAGSSNYGTSNQVILY